MKLPPIQSVSPGATPPSPLLNASSPLSPEELEQYELAQYRGKRLRRAAKVAKFNGITFAVFAGFTGLIWLGGLAFGKFNWSGLLITLALSLVACQELKGGKMLLAFDPRAPRRLGYNQLLLLGLVIIYCAYMMYNAAYGPSPYADQMGQMKQLDNMFGGMKKMIVKFTILTYGLVLVLSGIFVGGNAIYYFTREKLLKAYIEQTPEWILELQRRTRH